MSKERETQNDQDSRQVHPESNQEMGKGFDNQSFEENQIDSIQGRSAYEHEESDYDRERTRHSNNTSTSDEDEENRGRGSSSAKSGSGHSGRGHARRDSSHSR